MSIQKDYEKRVRTKVIGMLEMLIKKIKSGEVSVVSYGFWPTLDKKLMFKFDTLSTDFEKNRKDFHRYL